jgi:radical SAM PhpK family P-methyltransferase
VDYLERKIIKGENLRHFTLNFLNYQNKPHYASDILNHFCSQEYPNGKDYFNYWQGVMNNSIGYLGSYIHRHGFTFDYINSFQNQKVELARKLQRDDIRVVAITTTYYKHYIPVLEIIKFIKKHNPDTKIVIGGPLVFNQVSVQDSLENLEAFFGVIGADIYVSSMQGEATLVNVLDALKNNKSLDDVNNIYYKKGGKFVATRTLKEDNKLADNIVDWSLFADSSPEYVNVRTSVSCPFKCSFCGFAHRAGDYQRLSPELIIRELDTLNTIPTIKTVNFTDDTFNLPPGKFKTLLKMMIKRDYRFNWVSFFRCDFVDDEMAQLMKESGCLGVFLGIESANNQILKNMNKGVKVEKYYEKVALLKKFDLLVYGSFIVGFPGETEESVADSRRFIEESGIDFFSGKLWFMDPVSAIMQEKDKYGISGLLHEWTHNTMTSVRANEINEQMTMEAKNASYVPDYQFSFWWVLHLINKGLKFDTLKDFLNGFVLGLSDKLTGNINSNISPEVADKLRKISINAYDEINAQQTNAPKVEEDSLVAVETRQDSQNLIMPEFDL